MTMNTRRRFLQASSLAVAGLSHSSASWQLAATGTPKTAESSSMRDYWNDFPKYLTAVVNDARQRRKSELLEITTRSKAEARASFVRSKLWELIGNPLERTPLNARRTGVVERESYRIEKLIFESQAQFYVPAHLYLP